MQTQNLILSPSQFFSIYVPDSQSYEGNSSVLGIITYWKSAAYILATMEDRFPTHRHHLGRCCCIEQVSNLIRDHFCCIFVDSRAKVNRKATSEPVPLIEPVGCGGSLVGSAPFVLRVAGSNPSLATT